MSARTPADWSLPAASSSAPVLGSDQSACPANEHHILIDRSPCPAHGVHFTMRYFSMLVCYCAAVAFALVGPRFEAVQGLLKRFFGWLWLFGPPANFFLSTELGSWICFLLETAILGCLVYFAARRKERRLLAYSAIFIIWVAAGLLPYALSI